jgi:hypothetical protein
VLLQPCATVKSPTMTKRLSFLMYSPYLLMQAHSGHPFGAEL